MWWLSSFIWSEGWGIGHGLLSKIFASSNFTKYPRPRLICRKATRLRLSIPWREQSSLLALPDKYKKPPNGGFLYLSGSRESNPDHPVPNRIHYHYATPRWNEGRGEAMSNRLRGSKSKFTFILSHAICYDKRSLCCSMTEWRQGVCFAYNPSTFEWRGGASSAYIPRRLIKLCLHSLLPTELVLALLLTISRVIIPYIQQNASIISTNSATMITLWSSTTSKRSKTRNLSN